MNTCPSCGAPATNSLHRRERRQFYACESYSYGDALADQTDLCFAWQAIRNVRNLATTDGESAAQLLARVKEMLAL